MRWLFWFLLILIAYVYIGYPLLLTVWGKGKNKPPVRGEATPYLTLFIPVYNEEKIVRQKIENSLQLDYPTRRLEIIIASDASSDKTAQIAREYIGKGVILYGWGRRGGKNAVINRFLPRAKGEIIVFSDANSMLTPNALKELVRGFSDERVGCVCGGLKYSSAGETSVGKGEGLYFRYEAYLRKQESRRGAVVTASGALYAIRKELFSPLDLASPNDFVHPLEIKAKGYRVLYEPRAVAWEKPSASSSEEFKRRVRIVTRGITALYKQNKKYRLLSSSQAFYLVSHKLLRWFLPLFLLGLFVINLTLESSGYRNFLLLQVIFYLSALAGFLLQEAGLRIKIFYTPFYFCLINLAALLGVWKFYRGKQEIVWDVAASTR